MQEAHVGCCPVMTIADLASDTSVLNPVPAPLLGADTEAVLKEIVNCDPNTIDYILKKYLSQAE